MQNLVTDSVKSVSVMPWFRLLFSRVLAPFALLSLLSWSSAMAQPAALAVNGQVIPPIKMELVVNSALEAGQKDAAAARIQARESLIQHEILVQAARKAPLAEQAAVQAQAQFKAEATLVRAAAGGLMPWVVQGMLTPEAAQATASLSKGQMGHATVKGSAGFHIIRLEDSRPFTAPEFAQVQAQLQRNMEAQAVNAHIQKLREQASVK
jgi:parvulin-like peptidyl-prolyl isomerase